MNGRGALVEIQQDESGDWVCEHGAAMDVHCCGCHTGFIFDIDHVCEENQMPDETVIVTINGGKYAISANTSLSYRDVADIAGFKSPALPTMTLRQKSYEGRIIHPGESVMSGPGMVFNVADTSNA